MVELTKALERKCTKPDSAFIALKMINKGWKDFLDVSEFFFVYLGVK